MTNLKNDVLIFDYDEVTSITKIIINRINAMISDNGITALPEGIFINGDIREIKDRSSFDYRFMDKKGNLQIIVRSINKKNKEVRIHIDHTLLFYTDNREVINPTEILNKALDNFLTNELAKMTGV